MMQRIAAPFRVDGDVDSGPAEQVVREIHPAGGKAIARRLDVTDEEQWLGVKHAIRAMKPGGISGRGGSIINMASICAMLALRGAASHSRRAHNWGQPQEENTDGFRV